MSTNLRSTFPLDDAAIARAARKQIVSEPITWVALLPAVAVLTVVDLSWPVAAAVVVLAVGGLVVFWFRRWPELREKISREAIARHNLAQNEALQNRVDRFRAEGWRENARRLEEFLELKKLIERRLHDGGALTAQRVQLEQLVDSLCFEVHDQLTALAEHSHYQFGATSGTVIEQVDTAFKTLRTIMGDLDSILSPAAVAGETASASLVELTRRLQEEAEIARRVQTRLQPLVGDNSSPPDRIRE